MSQVLMFEVICKKCAIHLNLLTQETCQATPCKVIPCISNYCAAQWHFYAFHELFWYFSRNYYNIVVVSCPGSSIPPLGCRRRCLPCLLNLFCYIFSVFLVFPNRLLFCVLSTVDMMGAVLPPYQVVLYIWPTNELQVKYDTNVFLDSLTMERLVCMKPLCYGLTCAQTELLTNVWLNLHLFHANYSIKLKLRKVHEDVLFCQMVYDHILGGYNSINTLQRQ